MHISIYRAHLSTPPNRCECEFSDQIKCTTEIRGIRRDGEINVKETKQIA